ncbi:MAG: SDR family NAD(P)-dependent oxidoreductase [Hyphomicrobiaceae bacterium]
MSRPSRTVVITGASKGLGRALALAYAAPGTRLGLAGRSPLSLQETAASCEARGARVQLSTFDVGDHAATCAFIADIEAEGPIDILVANAGQFWGNGAAGVFEPVTRAIDLLRTNLEGAIVTVDAVLPGMRSRRHGQIALVTSLAALHPLADAPAYSASKAGLVAYGEALREFLAPEGIHVAVIYPGHIETAQTACHIGELPMLMSPDRAADIIVRGLAKRRSSIAFPTRLFWLIRLGRLAPWQLRARMSRSLRFHVETEKTTK